MNFNSAQPIVRPVDSPDSSCALPAMILLVEDELVTRTSMAARLKRFGYRVLEAGNGREALEMARRERPDLIVLD